jgi:phosphatidylinositol glycan class K
MHLTGRHHDSVAPSQRLMSDERSNVLVYLTGHGGNEFLKFQDKEELSAQDIADAFEQMHQQRRYHEILFVIDTCQAGTMLSRFNSPNIIGLASSGKGENSYAVRITVLRCQTQFINILSNIREQPTRFC